MKKKKKMKAKVKKKKKQRILLKIRNLMKKRMKKITQKTIIIAKKINPTTKKIIKINLFHI